MPRSYHPATGGGVEWPPLCRSRDDRLLPQAPSWRGSVLPGRRAGPQSQRHPPGDARRTGEPRPGAASAPALAHH
ncbi:hypothetical protein D7X75_39030, partial [Corallococcus sp. CA031C]